MFLPFQGHLDALGHHDNGKTLAIGFAKGNLLADFVNGEGDLGDQDDVGASGNSGFERDPACVPSHDFDHHDAMVRLSCGVDLVHGVSRGHERRIETESDLGGGKIVVDGLGHAYNVHALLEKLQCDFLRTVAADADHGIDSQLARVGDDLIRNIADDFRAVLDGTVVEGIAENRTAAGQNSAHIFEIERTRFFRPDQAIEAIGNADHSPVVFENGGFYSRADYRIQAGSISASGANADTADVRHWGIGHWDVSFAVAVNCEVLW